MDEYTNIPAMDDLYHSNTLQILYILCYLYIYEGLYGYLSLRVCYIYMKKLSLYQEDQYLDKCIPHPQSISHHLYTSRLVYICFDRSLYMSSEQLPAQELYDFAGFSKIWPFSLKNPIFFLFLKKIFNFVYFFKK